MKKDSDHEYELPQDRDAFIPVEEWSKLQDINNKEEVAVKTAEDELKNMKNCPYCAEEINSDAVKCRYCGEWLNQQTDKQTLSAVKSKVPDNHNSDNFIFSRWQQMSPGLKALTCFFIFVFLIGLLGNIMSAIDDNNRRASQQQAVKQQRAEQQAGQTQARIQAEQERSKPMEPPGPRTDDDRFDRSLRRMTGEETQSDRIERKLEEIQIEQSMPTKNLPE